jgi:hypothetical protein
LRAASFLTPLRTGASSPRCRGCADNAACRRAGRGSGLAGARDADRAAASAPARPVWPRLARPHRTRLELEADLAFLLVVGEIGLELAARLVRDEALEQIGLAGRQQLVICSRATGCCRMILPLLKSQVELTPTACSQT